MESGQPIMDVDGLSFCLAVSCAFAAATHLWFKALPDIRLWLAGPLARHMPRYSYGERYERKLARSSVIEELPHVMETLALACMSGLGLLQAIAVVGTLEGSPLFSVFRQVSNDIAAGAARSEALDHLGTRLNSRTAVSLVSTLKQAELSGTPIVSVLVSHAQAARREATIEKHRRIDLIPLKLVICTVLFLLPSVILAAIVPHIIAFTRTGW